LEALLSTVFLKILFMPRCAFRYVGKSASLYHVFTGCRPGDWDYGQLSSCQAKAHALFSSAPSMQKTKKSVAKRFKLTSTGKLVRRTPGFRHLLASKSTKQKRRASKDKLVAEGHAKPLKRCLPFGL
jgi:large subunit ribosomal protein L35